MNERERVRKRKDIIGKKERKKLTEGVGPKHKRKTKAIIKERKKERRKERS